MRNQSWPYTRVRSLDQGYFLRTVVGLKCVVAERSADTEDAKHTPAQHETARSLDAFLFGRVRRFVIVAEPNGAATAAKHRAAVADVCRIQYSPIASGMVRGHQEAAHGSAPAHHQVFFTRLNVRQEVCTGKAIGDGPSFPPDFVRPANGIAEQCATMREIQAQTTALFVMSQSSAHI